MFAPLRKSLISLSFSRADSSPTSGLAPAPRPLVFDLPIRSSSGADGKQVLGVGVYRTELCSADAGVDASVDGVAAATAASDNLDTDIQWAAIRSNSLSDELTAGRGPVWFAGTAGAVGIPMLSLAGCFNSSVR